ncbi:carboxylate-amine ligase [Agromyces sp. CF514]|uniref:carboxylate-amine ligase n=1 Tax=Agromyces sp. CF514 TaxID=1881031 RepID=UPI0008F45064|nr:YbdK family carboxylate-amine ligase [Agromyces sp. CF514]SFR78278.1 carboxylate-amine ligase [Agromyces sp. CF514]
MRTFGIEEEFQFLEPKALRPADVGAEAFRRLTSLDAWREVTHREFLASQVEHASRVFDRLDVAEHALAGFRRLVARIAADLGVVVGGTGTPPDTTPFPSVADVDRYRSIVREMDGIIADHQLSGLHVHVGIPDRESGVVVLNAVRPWLPLLTAITANSPLWRGHDTGYDSWRTVLLRRWTTSGAPPAFVDAADYDRRTSKLLGIGGTVDLAVIMWDVRISAHLPTVELRMGDAQLDADTTLFVAALCRAFVAHALERSDAAHAAAADSARMPAELLSAAQLHAAHSGMRGSVFDPITAGMQSAGETLTGFFRMLEASLAATGDLERAGEALDRMLVDGTGAGRQRAAFERGGTLGLRRLYDGTIAGGQVD